MTDMTIGQRIARERKKLGLSQEALGDKMGISRQAISKWESDAAIPEIDKLIALSKLFGVSVGWLLGTEEEPRPSSGGFSDEQFRMVEEIVKRYSQPPQPERKSRRWWKILAVTAAALALILSIKALRDANRDLPDYQEQIGSLRNSYSGIHAQLADLQTRLDEIAEGEKLLENHWSMEAEPWSDLTGATVRFSAVPRAWQESDQAYLVIRREGQVVEEALCQWDGSGCTATAELPAEDGYEYYYMVSHADGTQEVQTIATTGYGDYWAPTELKSALTYRCESFLGSWSQERNTLELGMLSTGLYVPELALKYGFELPKWESLRLVLFLNGAEIQQIPLVYQEGGETKTTDYALGDWLVTSWDTGLVDFNCHGIRLELPQLAEGDELTLYAVAAMTDGQEISTRIIGWSQCADALEALAPVVDTE